MPCQRKVEDLLEKFENAKTKTQREKLIGEILVELCVHAHLEEEHLYPVTKEEDNEMALEAFEELIAHQKRLKKCRVEKLVKGDFYEKG